jgi:hypothetical protein
MVRLSSVAAVFIVMLLVACGGKEPAPQPAAGVLDEPNKAEPKAAEPKKEEPKAAEPKKEEPSDRDKQPDDLAKGDPVFPDKVVDQPTNLVTATPGTIVKEPVPDSPEWLIQQVLVAAMEPDEAKGWALFESLLHEDQKAPNALATRRELNFAASRRKVKLFLFEDPTKPIYKVSRVVEESPTRVRIFVYNNSEGGMPTPCQLRMDENLKKWRVGICSL